MWLVIAITEQQIQISSGRHIIIVHSKQNDLKNRSTFSEEL
jgi:hypothetical protein